MFSGPHNDVRMSTVKQWNVTQWNSEGVKLTIIFHLDAPTQMREGWSSKQNHGSKCLVAPATIVNVRSETVKCVNAMLFSSQANDERGLILKAKPRKQMVGGSHNNNAMFWL